MSGKHDKYATRKHTRKAQISTRGRGRYETEEVVPKTLIRRVMTTLQKVHVAEPVRRYTRQDRHYINLYTFIAKWHVIPSSEREVALIKHNIQSAPLLCPSLSPRRAPAAIARGNISHDAHLHPHGVPKPTGTVTVEIHTATATATTKHRLLLARGARPRSGPPRRSRRCPHGVHALLHPHPAPRPCRTTTAAAADRRRRRVEQRCFPVLLHSGGVPLRSRSCPKALRLR